VRFRTGAVQRYHEFMLVLLFVVRTSCFGLGAIGRFVERAAQRLVDGVRIEDAREDISDHAGPLPRVGRG
jgi:hypothetical protein